MDESPNLSERLINWQERILAEVLNGIGSNKDGSEIATRVKEIASTYSAPEPELKEAVISAWERAVDKVLEDNILSQEEERALMKFVSSFDLGQDSLDRRGKFTLAAKGGILREVLNGRIPKKIQVDSSLPFNFMKSEELVWITNAHFFEERSARQFTGGYAGISIRVARGVYYKTGAFRGQPVATQFMAHLDRGLVAVTTKHIYFAGQSKRFRTRYEKIVAFQPYSDAIGFTKEGSTARPQVLVTGDGWFIYNLVMNLSRLAQGGSSELVEGEENTRAGFPIAASQPVIQSFIPEPIETVTHSSGSTGWAILFGIIAGMWALGGFAHAEFSGKEPTLTAAPVLWGIVMGALAFHLLNKKISLAITILLVILNFAGLFAFCGSMLK